MATAHSRHHCQYREDDLGWWKSIAKWWLLPTHISLAGALAFALLQFVKNHKFLVNGSDENELGQSFPRLKLYQSDVTTLVSLVLVFVRTLSCWWLSLAGWRMAFICLEKHGATLKQVDWMVGYLLPPTMLRKQVMTPREGRWLLPAMWLLFVLATPSQFVAPLVSGAVNWIPAVDLVALPSPLGITTAGPCSQWGSFNYWPNNRFYEVLMGAGLASIASPLSFISSESQTYRRKIPSLLGTPLNSTLANVTIPYFEIHSLDWVTSADEIEDDKDLLDQVISNQYAPTLNISQPLNPFNTGTDAGRLVMVNEAQWTPANVNESTSSYVYPSPVIDHATRWVVVATHFQTSCTDGPSPVFGPLPDVYQYTPSDPQGGCFVFARVNYTAAVITCKNCPIVLDGVVEAGSPSPSLSSWTPVPDPLVGDAIALMPEVLYYMKITNISSIPLWQNIDAYSRGMLSVAYQASWNSLTNAFQPAPMTATELKTPFPVLIADVKSWRVLAWFGINALLTVSGVVLVYLQGSCQGKTIRNTTLTPLVLDASAVLRRDTSGLCNAVDLNKQDESLRLRLVVSKNETHYSHPAIVPEEDEDDSGGGVSLMQLPKYGSRERLNKADSGFVEVHDLG
jgi:hypothetical protein